MQLYRRALDVLDEVEGGITDPTPSGELDSGSNSLHALFDERLRVHNNMAAAQLKAGAYDAALQVNTYTYDKHDMCYLLRRSTFIDQ